MIVTNYEKQSKRIGVEFDLKKIGFGTGVTASDAVTLESVSVEGGRLQLDVGPELFRLVKIQAASVADK